MLLATAVVSFSSCVESPEEGFLVRPWVVQSLREHILLIQSGLAKAKLLEHPESSVKGRKVTTETPFLIAGNPHLQKGPDFTGLNLSLTLQHV